MDGLDPVIDVYGLQDEGETCAFEYYVHQLHEVDTVLSHLVTVLSQWEEETILVAYGDHLPALETLELLVETGDGGLSPFGMTLALLSGVVFAAYIILLQREADQPLPLYHLMTATSLSGAVLCAALGLVTGSLTISLTPQAWMYAIATALLVSIGGSAVFQAGVRIVGDADAAIYSLLEPLTSIVFGLILLGEMITLRKGASCALILMGLLIKALADRKANRQ